MQLTANVAKCQSDVKREFARDTAATKKQEKKAAQASVNKVVAAQKDKAEENKQIAAAAAGTPVAAKGAKGAVRAGSASLLTVSLAVVALVAASLLF